MQPTKLNKKDSKKGKCGCGFLIAFFLLFAGLLVAGGYFLKSEYESSLNNPLSDSEEVTTFVVEQGESIDQIVENLVSVGIVGEAESQYLKVYIRLNNLSNSIQAGTFQIPNNLTIVELIETLQNATIPEIWVTIPEGLRYDEIADIYEEEFSNQTGASFSRERFIQLVENPEFVSSFDLNGNPEILEGFLFPDRYLLPLESTEEEIIQYMVENFKSKVGLEYTYDDIIIASLLEREGRTDTERKMIADIITRRLNEGWFLNIDATLLYNFKDWEHILTREDIDTDYPFNTYTRIGLTPTPISNPGLGSIEATQSPTQNDYYYYLHDPEGGIHYAKTFEEHSANIYNYLQ